MFVNFLTFCSKCVVRLTFIIITEKDNSLKQSWLNMRCSKNISCFATVYDFYPARCVSFNFICLAKDFKRKIKFFDTGSILQHCPNILYTTP